MNWERLDAFLRWLENGLWIVLVTVFVLSLVLLALGVR